MGVWPGHGLHDGHLVLEVLGGAHARVVKTKLVLESIYEDHYSFLEDLWRLVTVFRCTLSMIGQYLSSQEEPTGEDVDGRGVDNTHPDQEGEIL